MPTASQSRHEDWEARATAALEPHGIGPVRWVAETGSTNADLLEEAAAGAPSGAVLVTDHQTRGRGRRDRTWLAAPGDGLLVSTLVRPSTDIDRPGLLTAAMGVAAAEACHDLGFMGVRIKWPNDLVVGPPGGHRKLAGILAQSHAAGSSLAVVVGLGLNVRASGLAPALSAQAVALDDLGPPPERIDLLVATMARFGDWLAATRRGDDTRLWDRYRALSATLGTDVVCDLGDRSLRGHAVDVDDDGALLVATGGSLERIVAGDVASLRSAGS